MFPHGYFAREYFPGSFFPPMVDELVPSDAPSSFTRRHILYPPILPRRDEEEALMFVLAVA